MVLYTITFCHEIPNIMQMSLKITTQTDVDYTMIVFIIPKLL